MKAKFPYYFFREMNEIILEIPASFLMSRYILWGDDIIEISRKSKKLMYEENMNTKTVIFKVLYL